ncbi:hypothetical protein G7Z17_g12438 [Cylindrodendrum hubeiense]|uniref:Uncharacterized protein n=1 Tax=Cylindrodendrum hubeiense TaxID=595255 RepID=A0A9P5H327_9HYPO|nr:hypothetical protein G7Z17_g12438 [Cylindrodendrum hubeiense]
MESHTPNPYVRAGQVVLGIVVLGFLTSVICAIYQARQVKRRAHQHLRPRCEREDVKTERGWAERREHPWMDSIRAQERPLEDDLDLTPRDITPKEPPREEPVVPLTVLESIQFRWKNGYWGGSKVEGVAS